MAVSPSPSLLSGGRGRAVVSGALGVVVTVAVWWLLAVTVGHRYHLPTPWAVLTAAHDYGLGAYRVSFSPTLREAGLGFVYGVVAALVLSAVALAVPVLETLVVQAAVVTYCLPLVAIAPVLIVINPAPQPGHAAATAVQIAALSVFFTTVVGTVLGLKSADRTSLDVVAVYGGGRVQQLGRVRLVAALPSVISALQIAAPAAWLGALLGEFFDTRIENGVARALVLSQQAGDSALAWSLGLGCALVSGVGYLLLGVLGRVATPWARGAAG